MRRYASCLSGFLAHSIQMLQGQKNKPGKIRAVEPFAETEEPVVSVGIDFVRNFTVLYGKICDRIYNRAVTDRLAKVPSDIN